MSFLGSNQCPEKNIKDIWILRTISEHWVFVLIHVNLNKKGTVTLFGWYWCCCNSDLAYASGHISKTAGKNTITGSWLVLRRWIIALNEYNRTWVFLWIWKIEKTATQRKRQYLGRSMILHNFNHENRSI